MATNLNHHTAHDLGDRPNPAVNMLRPFRVRSVRAAGGDGVVRMKRDEYDHLLKRQPNAALRYIDESDGEVILVGSSLELDQRLQEPLENAPVTNAGVTIDLYGTGNRLLHTFDIDQDIAVVDEWRQLDQRTTADGQRAKAVFWGSISPLLSMGKEKTEGANEVRFGQVSPPRSSLKASTNSAPGNAHASRWASYSNLPGSFDHEPVPVKTDDKDEPKQVALSSTDAGPTQDNAATGQNQSEARTLRSAFDVMADPAAAPVRSSTLQVPATQKQKNEYQPLIDMFFTEQKKSTAGSDSDASKDQAKQWQPLLDLFEGQLAELTGPSGAAENPEPSTSSRGPFAQRSGEILAQSIQSLLSGVGLLAATFKKTNTELQQQIALAQQDFPNNIEKALKASVAAIESLKSMIPAANAEDAATALNSEGREGSLPAAPSSTAEGQISENIRNRMYRYRHKLQNKLIKARATPSQEDLRMLNDIISDLELRWKGLEAEVLVETKIHKVMKVVGRMTNVPGDTQFSFKKRCAELLAVWKTTLEAYRQGRGDIARSTANSEAVQLLDTQEPSEAQTIAPPNAEDELNAKQVPLDTTTAQDDDQVDRVEKATEEMRRELLGLGILPPAQRLPGGVYTRADVLEAYIEKFNELKAKVGEKTDLSAEGSTTAEFRIQRSREVPESNRIIAPNGNLTQPLSQQLNTESLVNADGNEARSTATGPGQAKESNTSAHSHHVPKKAVSFDYLGRGSAAMRKAVPADPFAPAEQIPSERSVQAPIPVSEPSPQGPPVPGKHWPETKPTLESGSRQVRHRQSWHPASNPGPFASKESADNFHLSASDVMARYPPISQINRNSPWSVGPASKPDVPTLWRSSTLSTRNSDANNGSTSASHPRPFQGILKPAHSHLTGANETGFGSPAQRSTSTRVTRSEQEQTRGNRPRPRDGTFQGRRNRRTAGIEPASDANQNNEARDKDVEIRKCVDQLTGMGFAKGKADAVATAVVGNLEMALDVLNEDSAAWEAKAKQDEERELGGRQREDVPGSWGSWDDELYG